MHCNVDTICIEVNVARSQDIPEIQKKSKMNSLTSNINVDTICIEVNVAL